MDWELVLTTVVGLISGGGVTALFLLPQRRLSEEIANIRQIVDEYQDLYREAKSDNEKKSEYISVLQADLNEKHEELMRVGIDNARLRIFKCEDVKCGDRKPPIAD